VKCNTHCRFDIGVVDQDHRECCHAIVLASVGCRERPDRGFVRFWAVNRSRRHCAWPGDIDIDGVSDQEIKDILLTANLTLRKCLGFKTPFQAILAELGKDAQIPF